METKVTLRITGPSNIPFDRVVELDQVGIAIRTALNLKYKLEVLQA